MSFGSHAMCAKSSFLVVAFFLVASNEALCVEGDSALRDRFISGMLNAKQLLGNICVHLRSETVREFSAATIEADNSPKRIAAARSNGIDLSRSVFIAEFALCNESIMSRGERGDGVHFVLAENPDYGFHLVEAPDSEAYVLQALQQTGSINPELEDAIQKQRQMATAPMYGAWSFLGTPMWEVVEGDGFRVEEIEEIVQEGRQLVRVEFDPGDAFALDRAHVICDPENQWAFFEIGWTSAIFQKTSNFEYGERVNEVPLVTRMSDTGTWIEKPDNIDTVIMTQEIIDKSVSPDVFRLSSYGLREPNFERSWYSGTWLTYLLGGLACFGVAYWLRQRRLAAA